MTEDPKPKRNTNANRPKKKAPDDHRPGVACSYTKERGDYVCDIVMRNAMGVERLHKKFKDQGFPDQETILTWRKKYPDFRDQFWQAKLLQSQLYAEEIYDIADDKSEDLIQTDKGLSPNSTAVARAKLQIETRKWMASRLLPRIYGERTFVENKVSISHEDALKELE